MLVDLVRPGLGGLIAEVFLFAEKSVPKWNRNFHRFNLCNFVSHFKRCLHLRLFDVSQILWEFKAIFHSTRIQRNLNAAVKLRSIPISFSRFVSLFTSNNRRQIIFQQRNKNRERDEFEFSVISGVCTIPYLNAVSHCQHSCGKYFVDQLVLDEFLG